MNKLGALIVTLIKGKFNAKEEDFIERIISGSNPDPYVIISVLEDENTKKKSNKNGSKKKSLKTNKLDNSIGNNRDNNDLNDNIDTNIDTSKGSNNNIHTIGKSQHENENENLVDFKRQILSRVLDSARSDKMVFILNNVLLLYLCL